MTSASILEYAEAIRGRYFEASKKERFRMNPVDGTFLALVGRSWPCLRLYGVSGTLASGRKIF